MKGYRLLELLLKHQAFGRASLRYTEEGTEKGDRMCNLYDDLIHEIEGEILEELRLELDSYGTVYPEKVEPPSQPAKLLRAVDDIFEYLKESEIDGWENLQKDLKDLKEKALDEMDFLEMPS